MGLGGGLVLNTLIVRATSPLFPPIRFLFPRRRRLSWRLAGVLLLLHHSPLRSPTSQSSPLWLSRPAEIERPWLLPTAMEEPESPYQPSGAAPAFRSGAGVVSSIRLENFMCHSSLKIEFGDHVNFITGQNGSGKSAILTALCVAFGSRAKGTQRASTLKEFIKTGFSHAVVQVELKNDGEDAFKPEIFGNMITIERRITQTNSLTILKDYRGKRVENGKGGKGGLRELVEHYNIDVENPCVIMSQDKSREFLHSGNDKEKFKFFFKATLLQQVNDLLQDIRNQLDAANATVDSLESSIKPIESELEELSGKIKNMEYMEEISQQVQQLKKKLAWAWVYDVDRQIQEQSAKLAKLKDRVPTCQEKIDRLTAKVASLKEQLLERRQQIASMMEKTSEVKRMKEELRNALSLAVAEEHEINEEHRRGTNVLQKLHTRFKTLEQKVHDLEAQHVQNTQAEESAIEEQRSRLQNQIDAANETLERLKGEENELCEQLSAVAAVISQLAAEIEENDKKCADIRTRIRDLKQRRVNKVTAFGGEKVTSLLRCIERHHRQFRNPPIGPIGAHLALTNGDRWALAIEHAIGKFFNTFIVTDHADMRTLRKCSKEANYQNLNIVIYDFSKSRLHIPNHMLPSTNHPTVLSVIQSDNPTVLNVLIDLASAERQVLVSDYDTGKSVVFGQKVPNLKEAYTMDGHKMFFRGSVQTVLPPNKKIRSERLCSSVEDQIRKFGMYLSNATETLNQCRSKKRHVEETHRTLLNEVQLLKKRCQYTDKEIMEKHMNLKDLNLNNITTDPMDTTFVDDLNEDIKKVAEEIQGQEIYLEKMQSRKAEAGEKVKRMKISSENLCESAKVELLDFEEAEKKLLSAEDEIRLAEEEKSHYENIMGNKVLLDIEGAEANYKRLKQNRLESCKKASIICPESEVEALGGCGSRTPDQLSAQLSRLSQRLQNEAQRHTDSIDDLRELYDQKERKIKRKRIMYNTFRDKLGACQKALDLRWSKFQRNATLLKRQLTWQFNGHLRKKGISGLVKVNYEDKTLSIEVKMPQDTSNSAVRDTRGLSGGERSFSTLCFAMALHEMTEAPFRAMDEFDVFMDAISRKISLDTLVDFSVSQGSQWILITPHDISMVKSGERIKKQQMAAPRGS